MRRQEELNGVWAERGERQQHNGIQHQGYQEEVENQNM